MNATKLKDLLLENMNSGDCRMSRLIGNFPDLFKQLEEYVTREKRCTDMTLAFANILLDWNKYVNEVIHTNYNNLFDFVIAEVNSFNIFFNELSLFLESENFNTKKDLAVFDTRLKALSVSYYKKLASVCEIKKNNSYSRSKIMSRFQNFKYIYSKFKKGSIDLERLILEVNSQKEFFNKYYEGLLSYEKTDFPLYVLCYDIKADTTTKIIKMLQG